MSTISLCMITKNEEKFLKQCLESVKGLVDEIIILDTGSTDKTKEIAAEYTDKIHSSEWTNDFSAARNESMKYATKEWILILDADETISLQDHEKIKKMIETETEGFTLVQRNYLNDSKELGWRSSKGDEYPESRIATGWCEERPVRLFKNNKEIQYSGEVHESVIESVKGEIEQSNIPIHHYGKLDIEKLKQKNLLYKKIGEKKVQTKKDYKAYLEIGKQYLGEKEFEKAKKAFEKSIELNRENYESWFMIGCLFLMINELDNALSKLKRAQALNHHFAPTYANLGTIYAKKKEYKKAIKNFVQAIKLNPRNATTYKNLGVCYDSIGEKQKAHICFKKAIDLNPNYKNKIKISEN